MKILMAVTGLILVAFLLMHMYGNLKMFLGPDSFNHYAHWLKGTTEDGGIMYPLLPAGWFIWIFRAVLLASIVAHMWSAAVLTGRSLRARGRYQRTDRRAQTYAARTMRWGGIILALVLLFHLAQFTALLITPGFDPKTATPYSMVVASFSQLWVVVLYAIWMIAVCLHVRHGFWSAFTTLGGNTSAGARKVLNGLAVFVAALLYLGFMIMPIAVYAGLVK